MSASPVLDSHALLSFLRDEPGADKVATLLGKAERNDKRLQMTEVSYAEVQYIVRRKEGEAAWRVIADELTALPIEFHSADRRLADLAAEFKSRFKISLADAFTAALAKLCNAELVTGDREFRALDAVISIIWI